MAKPKLKIILTVGTDSRELLGMVHRADEAYSWPSSLSLAQQLLAVHEFQPSPDKRTPSGSGATTSRSPTRTLACSQAALW